MELLYNPERTAYAGKKSDECPFCSKFDLNDEHKYEHLIVKQTEHSVIMLNLFPYNPGHLLVIPKNHCSDISLLSIQEYRDLFDTVLLAIKAAKIVTKSSELNMGINMGKSSGGSVQDHLHVHVVPRFNGDTNFLAVLAGAKVVTKDLKTMFDLYSNYFV